MIEFHPKTAGITAAAAFFLSFMLGLASGAESSSALLKAFIFAVVFFALAVLFSNVFSNFLSKTGESAVQPEGGELMGGNVDISLDDAAPQEGETAESEVSPDGAEGGGAAAFQDGDGASLPSGGGAGATESLEELDTLEPLESAGGAGAGGLEQKNNSSYNENESNLSSLEGKVEMSVAGKPAREIKMSDLGSDVDGKKIANAIHTLLKKDEEG